MPRNRYTKGVHKSQSVQIAQQLEKLEKLACALRLGAEDDINLVVPVINKDKLRRSGRREQARRHKPERFRAGDI